MRDLDPRGDVVVGARQAGAVRTFECWVSDNGEGIPPDRLEKVFDKSETGKEGGRGLGLADAASPGRPFLPVAR